MLNAKIVTLAVCQAIFISRSAYPANFIRGDINESGTVEMADPSGSSATSSSETLNPDLLT